MFAVLFANNVIYIPPLFAVNVVSKMPCLRFEAFMFAVRYTYRAIQNCPRRKPEQCFEYLQITLSAYPSILN